MNSNVDELKIKALDVYSSITDTTDETVLQIVGAKSMTQILID